MDFDFLIDRRAALRTTLRGIAAVGGAWGTASTMLSSATMASAAAETPPAPPQGLPIAKPEEIGLDSRQLQVAYDLLDRWTQGDKPLVPGGAIVVGRHGKMVAPRFFGKIGPEPDAAAMPPDAIFLMASLTKPIVYTAAMQLVELGRLNLTDPVIRYLPEFAAHNKSEVLVRDLFTHTSGLPDMLPNNFELRKQQVPLQTFLNAAVRDTELVFRPGTQVRYQSMGTAVVAEILQKRWELPIAEVLKRQIVAPLGLTQTTLGAKGLERRRLVRVQTPDYQTDRASDWNSDYWRDLGAPWGGLFSTPSEFAVLCQMFLNRGTYAGRRILSPASVRAMTTNRLHEYAELPAAIARTRPWGLGWRLNHPGTADSWGDLLGPNVFGHTGATGNLVWIDPDAQGFCIVLTNAIREKAPWHLVHLSNALAAAFV